MQHWAQKGGQLTLLLISQSELVSRPYQATSTVVSVNGFQWENVDILVSDLLLSERQIISKNTCSWLSRVNLQKGRFDFIKRSQ